jgi:hypothetical protein
MQGSTTEDIMRFSITRTASIAAAVTTLAGCGVATAAGTNTHTISAPTAVTRAAAVPSLTPAQVRYEHRSWGDPKTEVGVIVWTPANWRMVKLSTFEAEFISPNALWNLRINGSFTPGQKPVKSAVDAKIAALKATKGLRIISRVDGTTKATSPYSGGLTFHHTTLTYSYTDGARGSRLVVDRFVAVFQATGTDFEISAGGRPQDKAGLDAITAKATQDYARLP